MILFDKEFQNEIEMAATELVKLRTINAKLVEALEKVHAYIKGLEGADCVCDQEVDQEWLYDGSSRGGNKQCILCYVDEALAEAKAEVQGC